MRLVLPTAGLPRRHIFLESFVICSEGGLATSGTSSAGGAAGSATGSLGGSSLAAMRTLRKRGFPPSSATITTILSTGKNAPGNAETRRGGINYLPAAAPKAPRADASRRRLRRAAAQT